MKSVPRDDEPVAVARSTKPGSLSKLLSLQEPFGLERALTGMSLPQLSIDGTAIALSMTTPEVFTEVFDRHFRDVHRYLARRVGSDRADDLAAQTFTLAFAHRGRYRDDLGTARPWLLGIATNLLRADQRVEQRRLELIARLPRPEVSVTAASSLGFDPELTAALGALDRDQRDALLLHVWGELSYPEVADVLEIPVGTVRSRISRAYTRLRSVLGNPQSDSTDDVSERNANG